MAINKSMRRVLKALSFDGIEVEASGKFKGNRSNENLL